MYYMGSDKSLISQPPLNFCDPLLQTLPKSPQIPSTLDLECFLKFKVNFIKQYNAMNHIFINGINVCILLNIKLDIGIFRGIDYISKNIFMNVRLHFSLCQFLTSESKVMESACTYQLNLKMFEVLFH